jgi:predicted house-cleaning NTP pyrophosphatase (Maf/HAM1 superfamily)
MELPVVLGSSSNSRRELFSKHFPEHLEVMAADIDEKAVRADSAEDLTLRCCILL